MRACRLLCFFVSLLNCRAQLVQQFHAAVDPGTSRSQALNNMAADGAGNSYVLTSVGDVRVTKVDSQGRVIYVRQFGGSADDKGTAIAADAAGNVWIAGLTESSDFPATLPPVTTLPGTVPASVPVFAVKLDPAGNIAWSVLIPYFFLYPQALTTDASGALYMTGGTTGAGQFTTPGSFGTNRGLENAFVLKLSPAGDRIVWAAALGGATSVCIAENNCPPQRPSLGVGFGISPETERGNAIAVDSAGNVYVGGVTNDSDFPVTAGAFQSTCTCHVLETNGFLSKISADGSRLLYSTYIGGAHRASVEALAIDSGGEVWAAGSSAVPTTAAPFSPGFLAKLTADGSALRYTADLTKSDSVQAVRGLALNSDGTVTVAALAFGAGSVTDVVGFDATASTILYNAKMANGEGDWGFAARAANAFAVAGSAGLVTGFIPGSSAAPSVYALTDSATVTARTRVAPGELITLYGARLGPESGSVFTAVNGFVPTTLAGTQVLFDGVPAPLLYVSANQVNAVVPYEVFGRDETRVQVVSGAGTSSSTSLTYQVVAADPVLVEDAPTFTVAFNQDGSRNSPRNPAAAGSTVTVLASGAGMLVNPGGVTGRIATNLSQTGLSQTELPVSVLVQLSNRTTQSAPVIYAGPVPGVVSGMLQVQFIVPEGEVGFVIQTGDAISQSGSIAVR